MSHENNKNLESKNTFSTFKKIILDLNFRKKIFKPELELNKHYKKK